MRWLMLVSLMAVALIGLASVQSSPVAAAQSSGTRTPTLTRTPRPTVTPRPTATPVGQRYTTTSQARVRECSSTTCDIVTTLAGGVVVTVTASEDGERVSGSRMWRAVTLENGRTGFIHSSLLRQGVVTVTRAAATASSSSNNSGGGGGGNTSQPPAATSVPPAQPQWTCSGDIYNCGDFSNRTDLMSYFNACPGDPSRLDGNNDGVPCESLR